MSKVTKDICTQDISPTTLAKVWCLVSKDEFEQGEVFFKRDKHNNIVVYTDEEQAIQAIRGRRHKSYCVVTVHMMCAQVTNIVTPTP